MRPAYMDEYERLQGELQDLFTLYLQRFRSVGAKVAGLLPQQVQCYFGLNYSPPTCRG